MVSLALQELGKQFTTLMPSVVTGGHKVLRNVWVALKCGSAVFRLRVFLTDVSALVQGKIGHNGGIK
jgi:hypothetical protein